MMDYDATLAKCRAAFDLFSLAEKNLALRECAAAIDTLRGERDEAREAAQRRADELNVLSGSIAAYHAGELEAERDAALARAEKTEYELSQIVTREAATVDVGFALKAERDALRALLREAGAALEPFADARIGLGTDDKAISSSALKTGDLRRARAMLAKIKGEVGPAEPTDDGQPDESQEWRDFDPDC